MRAALLLIVLLMQVVDVRASPPPPMLKSTLALSADGASIVVEYSSRRFERPGHALFVAIDSHPVGGCAFAPYGHGQTGSTVALPFRADRLYIVHGTPTAPARRWQEWRRGAWSTSLDVKPEFTAEIFPNRVRMVIPIAALNRPAGSGELAIAVWAKDLSTNEGWGTLLPDAATGLRGGNGDRSIDRYYAIDLETKTATVRSRRDRSPERVRIYQLLPRLFTNTNETRKLHGTLAENGCGKFNDLTETALLAIRSMGFTHLWLTGVLNQATATDYSEIGLPADDPAILKGLAGSPYAIRDLFDVSPDYAQAPAERLLEFRALILRAHSVGLKVLMDFVPNHVARSHRPHARPELAFGQGDDPAKFFDPMNNFFWLQPDSPGGGPPLRLPSADGESRVYGPEAGHGRVTGNNACTWSPSLNDWYETAKLNYGYDFTTGTRAYPHADAPDLPLPDTWRKMDAVIAWWQAQGVDGFRCDMAHMVPPEFWSWLLDRARQRSASVFFAAEAYDNDPMKVGAGNVMLDLLGAGFDAVYDDPSYKVLKGIYEHGKWANDLDGALAAVDREFIFQNSLRYAENHDEVRLAARGEWGAVGPEVGRAVSAILYGIGRGPLLLYSGQEVGEPAVGTSGFAGDNGRTTIFDYWSMPEVAKWVNDHHYDGGRLSPQQRDLRAFYARLIRLVGEPAFRDGEFFALNYAQRDNPDFGRLPGDNASGHWLYAFLRNDAVSGQRFLCVVNLHPSETLHGVRVVLPPEAREFIGLDSTPIDLRNRLGSEPVVRLTGIDPTAPILLSAIPPLTPYFFEF